MPKLSNRARLMAGGALAALTFTGYAPRGAYAGSCDTTDPLAITCSGAADVINDRTQIAVDYGVSVATEPGFGIDTRQVGGSAFILGIAGGAPTDLSFVDESGSLIAGNFAGIQAYGLIDQLTITTSGDVIGVAGRGLDVYQAGSATLTLNNVAGREQAVRVNASGTIDLNASGTIRSYNFIGVDAENLYGPIDLRVNDVYAAGNGVDAVSYYGSVAVTATGRIVAEGRYGISARAPDAGDAVTINAVDVTGDSEAVYAYAGGDVSVTLTGTATGVRNDGVDASSREGSVFVTVLNAYGGGDGVDVEVDDSEDGSIFVTSSGTIRGEEVGVNADGGDGLIRIFVADVTGGEDGVTVDGSGAVSVTVTGTATGETNDGIDVETESGNISIFAQNATGADEGIEAQTGFNASGTVISGEAYAIYVGSSGTISGGEVGVQTRTGYGNSYLSVNDVEGGEFGIEARSYAGDIQINASGSVTASSGTAIYARTYGDGYQRSEYYGPGDIRSYDGNIITVQGDVTGSVNGVEFVKDQYTYELFAGGPVAAPGGSVNGGEVQIDVEGSVRGGSGAGILVRQVENGPGSSSGSGRDNPLFASIFIAGDVSAESGVAIDASSVEASISINESATITGDILLGAYSDGVNLNSATLTADTRIFAGENPEDSEGDMLFVRRFTDDFLGVTGDTSVVASNLHDFNQLFIGEYATLTVADVDEITLESSRFNRIRLLGAGDAPAEMRRRGFIGGDLNVYGGELVAGTDLTINVAQAVVVGTSYSYDFDASTSTTITTVRSVGQFTLGGTPGESRVEMNFEVEDDYAGFYNGGRINMANGAPGDEIVVNGEFGNTGDINVDISPSAGTDAITARGDVFVVGQIDVNVIDATELGRTEHVVISSTSGTVTEGRFIDELEEEGDDEVIVIADSQPTGAIVPGEEREIPETLTAVTDSVVADVDVRVEETEVIVGVDVNFVPDVEEPEEPEGLEEDPLGTDGLSDNATVIGETLNETIGDLDLVALRQAALSATSIEELETLYIALGGADFAATISSAQAMGLSFGQGLFSCAVGEGTFAPIDEGQCGYTRIGGTYTDVDANPGEPGFDATTFDLTFGGQIELDENLRLGGSVGYNRIDGDGAAGLDFSADRIAAGASVKYVEGPFMAGLSLSGGYTFADTDRTVAGFGVADAEFDGFDVSAIARAAYLFDAGDGLYVKPQIEAGVTHVDRDGFTETGAGAANLIVASESETFFTLAPSIEIGGDFELEDGMKVRPFVRVGATFISGESVETTAAFAGAAAQPFTTTVSRDDVFGDVATGVTFFSEGDLSVRAEYQGRFSDDTMSHGGFLKIQIKF
ncbi:MAG: autotransporter outer membrane beta-barrel domain-containing protein [Pseudomonadota bacterium]